MRDGAGCVTRPPTDADDVPAHVEESTLHGAADESSATSEDERRQGDDAKKVRLGEQLTRAAYVSGAYLSSTDQ